MEQNATSAELQRLKDENIALGRENRRLGRVLATAQRTIETSKESVAAKNRLSAILAAEKSKQEKHLKLLLESCPDIIMLFDKEGRFIYCTDIFLRSAGIINFGLVNGRLFTEVFELFAERLWIEHVHRFFLEVMATKKAVIFEEIIDFGKRGNPRNYSMHITPMLDEHGEAEGALALFHDFTEVLRAKVQAEQANRAKSDFLAMFSHEIRTPLNAVIGLTDMMKKTELDTAQRGYLHSIENSSRVLLNLINDILDFSKIEVGKLDLLQEFFSLRAMLAHTESIFGLMFQQKQLEFICHIDESLPEVVYGDEKRVGQVLSNLLNNAYKYTKSGYARLDAYADQATGMVCFDVTDSGIGIREEDIPRLFTAFEQLDSIKNKGVVGTGLGLPITKQLCEKMDGSIDVTSSYGKGSCFSVRLRLRMGEKSDLPIEDRVSIEFLAPEARVLIVDDIEINLLVASAMLEGYGIIADKAHGGIEAVNLAAKNNYDVIFMDHMMPDMDGIEATQRIRALDSDAAMVPIVALTANAISGMMEMFVENGFNDFISKPIDPRMFSTCLLKWLPKTVILKNEP